MHECVEGSGEASEMEEACCLVQVIIQLLIIPSFVVAKFVTEKVQK